MNRFIGRLYPYSAVEVPLSHSWARRTGAIGAGLAVCLAVSTATSPAGATPGPTAATAAGLRPGPVTTPLAADSAPSPFNVAPTSRTLAPVAVRSTLGSVTAGQNVLTGRDSRLIGTGSGLVLDFGKEVGGLTTLSFHATSDATQQIGLAFSESSLYAGVSSDASNGGSGADGALLATVPANGSYTVPKAKLRGGFRYLTVFLNSSGWVDLSGISLQYTAAPTMPDPSAYPNYFHSNDDLLNRIWYAGAYTVQTNTIAPDQGRVWGPPVTGWDNSATVGVGTSVLTDGAKRDRTVWPGDLGVSVPTAYVSTNDLTSTRNALQTMYNAQQASGELPFAGPPVNFHGSDTYHLWTLLGTSLYYRYSQDKTWVDTVWAKYKLGLAYSIAKIDANNLLSVTGTADWARSGQGGENIEANALLYGVLLGGATLATAEGDTARATEYRTRAAALRAAANARLWDAGVGMYRDNPTSTLKPQDGNALAVWLGLADTPARTTAIAGNLADRWNALGARTPEKGDTIATFPGSMEVHAHFTADDDVRGLELIRREWGYMLNSPIGTGSTFWEGYQADGSFDYNGSYMSLSHGWATGPTSALTFDVLGLSPGEAAGSYRFAPHPGDLTAVEGRITLPQGALDATWSRDQAAGTFTAHLTSPAGTSGTIGVPTLGGGHVVVRVNGAVVWNAGTFTARGGITGASQDGEHLYLTGVPAGTWTISAEGVGAPAELPVGYTRCADEGATCTVPGTRTVAYGAGRYVYRTITSGTPCSTAAFGTDPALDLQKSCYLAPAGGPGGYAACAAENGRCAFTGPRTVAYGAAGAFRYLSSVDGVACDSATFGGDPIAGVAKQCYLPPDAGPDGRWTRCAAEGSTCPAVIGQTIAYGTFGAFSYTRASTAAGSTPATGSAACGNPVFGDPIPNAAKACYLRTGSPAGFAATACAAENGSCTPTGRQTVAYGASGRFSYRTLSGTFACNSATFGADPLFGAAKFCYLPS
jgi:hypothetical protein